MRSARCATRATLNRILALCWRPPTEAFRKYDRRVFSFTKGAFFPRKAFSSSAARLCSSSPVDNADESVRPSTMCKGCGARFHSDESIKGGYLPPEKLKMVAEGEVMNTKGHIVVCQRCFYLSHYNQALNASVAGEDYLQCLEHVTKKSSLVLCMVDVTDFPGSLFPDLNTRIGRNCPVIIVANKVDLLPSREGNVIHALRVHIRELASKGSLSGCDIVRIQFVSAKFGSGVEELTDVIVKNWGTKGDVFLLGCTNVGKSTLFNQLLVLLCGAVPGHLNPSANMEVPSATISHWPGTTLGLLSFPIMPVGARFRLLKEKSAALFAPAQRLADWEQPEFVPPKYKRNSSIENQADDGHTYTTVVDEALEDIGLTRRKRKPVADRHGSASISLENKSWLHDTPGAVNKVQVCFGVGWLVSNTATCSFSGYFI